MAEEIKNQFNGLDMASLIGGPLKAVCDAQMMMAASTVNFINEVGITKVDGKDVIRTTSFSFERGILGEDGQSAGKETVSMNVPILSIVKIPSLCIDDVGITFDMEVKSSESSESSSDKSGSLDASAKLKLGPFSMNVSIKGSVSCHEKNTRSTDNSAKYHVSIHAKDTGMPEGLARMLDILSTASTPTEIASTKKKAIEEKTPSSGESVKPSGEPVKSSGEPAKPGIKQ